MTVVPDLFADSAVTVREMLAEAERELHMRQSVYPRRVSNGKMTQAKADRAIKVQQAIIKLLREFVPSPASEDPMP
jgi:HEPN domain-containing protein